MSKSKCPSLKVEVQKSKTKSSSQNVQIQKSKSEIQVKKLKSEIQVQIQNVTKLDRLWPQKANCNKLYQNVTTCGKMCKNTKKAHQHCREWQDQLFGTRLRPRNRPIKSFVRDRDREIVVTNICTRPRRDCVYFSAPRRDRDKTSL